MNTKNKIIAILMAGIVAMAVGVPMAFGGDVQTSANVGDVPSTYTCSAAVSTAPTAGSNGQVDFELVVTDENGADDIPEGVWTAEWGSRVAVNLSYKSKTATTKTFNGSDTIPYCTAPGDYLVSFEKTGSEVCNDTFNVGSYAGFTLFGAINYDGVAVNVKTVVTPGDLNNTGNSNMTIKINATKMTPGVTYDPGNASNVDMNQSAVVPSGGVEESLPAGNWVSFTHEFVCSQAEPLNFSITAPEGTGGTYTGQISIEAQ